MIPPGSAAVVTAAGGSRRMAGGSKKEYRLLAGVPVLARAVLPFVSAGFSPVVVTVPRGDVPQAAALLAAHFPPDAVRFVEGGATRQESVRRGLQALAGVRPRLVLIHDGARPWVSADLVHRVAEVAGQRGACVPVVDVSEAVKQVGEAGLVLAHLPRHTIRFAQTPQGFLFDRILAAHDRAAAAGSCCVDDAEVYALYEGPVAWVDGEPDNRKITVERDLEAT